MKKKFFMFVLVALMVFITVPFNTASAYYPVEESLLTGKPFNLNDGKTTTVWTDGDSSTKAVLGTGNGFTGYKIFDTPVAIDQAYFKVMYGVANLKFTFEDDTTVTLSQAGGASSSGGPNEYFITVPSEKKVKKFDLYGNNAGGQLYEIDLRVASVPESPELTALGGDSIVTLNWKSISDATSYNVKRALTSGGPYETVGSNIMDSAYSDTNVTNGVTYYYVVTTVTSTAESQNSNEVSATPNTTNTEPEPSGDRAILTITMITGLEKEFDLSMEEVNDFINWYDAKENGVGPARYGIDKHNNNKGPFSKRVDYVVFKNILSFEVSEYSINE